MHPRIFIACLAALSIMLAQGLAGANDLYASVHSEHDCECSDSGMGSDCAIKCSGALPVERSAVEPPLRRSLGLHTFLVSCSSSAADVLLLVNIPSGRRNCLVSNPHALLQQLYLFDCTFLT